MRLAVLLVIAASTLGAACQTQQQNLHNLLSEPLYIKCKGKGRTTIMVGPYSGFVESDCAADGFEYSIERGPLQPR